MADPARTDLLNFAYIWYQPLSKEISDTWARLPQNFLGVPVFALLIWLHTPLWRYFAGLIGALATKLHRRIVIAALAIVSAGYPVMFAIVFDYSRWVSNWAVCMFLILHAVKVLPAARDLADPVGRPEDNYLRLDRHADPARRNRAAVLDTTRLFAIAYPDIERALAAMADMRFLEADHQRAEFRQASHCGTWRRSTPRSASPPHPALAGDDEHEGHAVTMGALQEAEQRPVGVSLGHAVQIEPRLDLLFGPLQFERSRRPSGASGGMAGFAMRTAGAAAIGRGDGADRVAGAAGEGSVRGGVCVFATRCFRSGLTCFATASHSARSSSLSARRRGEVRGSSTGGRGRSLHCCRWGRFSTGRRGS